MRVTKYLEALLSQKIWTENNWSWKSIGVIAILWLHWSYPFLGILLHHREGRVLGSGIFGLTHVAILMFLFLYQVWSVILMNSYFLQCTSSTKHFIPHTVGVRADKVDISCIKTCMIFWETYKLIIYNIQKVRKGRKALSTAKPLNIFSVCYCYNLSHLFLYNRTKTW